MKCLFRPPCSTRGPWVRRSSGKNIGDGSKIPTLRPICSTIPIINLSMKIPGATSPTWWPVSEICNNYSNPPIIPKFRIVYEIWFIHYKILNKTCRISTNKCAIASKNPTSSTKLLKNLQNRLPVISRLMAPFIHGWYRRFLSLLSAICSRFPKISNRTI